MTARSWAGVALAAVATMLGGGGAAGAAGSGAHPGAPGIGDPYVPLAGNGGYDVRHYSIDIRYVPRTNRLVGRTRIDAVATQNLSRFDLDFVGMQLRSLRVNGARASFARTPHELVVTPPRALHRGASFTVAARYAGVPATFTVPGLDIETGVVPTDDGAVIWGEPDVAAAWFPVNDHPRDKASYAITVTVPRGLEAISNGRLVSQTTAGAWTTWRWRERAPMASYLATAVIGQFDIRRRTGPGGIPILDAVDRDLGDRADHALALEGRIVRFLARRFGPYPFDALGGIVDDKRIGAALENQTRPVYDFRFFGGEHDEIVVVHELAHQWYGDSVSVDTWRHTWLNEGFATYAELLWMGAHGLATPAQFLHFLCTIKPSESFWSIPPAAPGRDHIFDAPVYIRGAMTLQMLRRTVGSRDFFHILRAWAAGRAGSTGTTAQLLTLSERISGRRLGGLFHEMLFRPAKPRLCANVRGGPVSAKARATVRTLVAANRPGA